MRDSELNTATLPATLREMMRRINDLATRPFGVRSIGPGDGSLTITDASGNDITSLSGDEGWSALVDGAKTDVPGLLTNLKTSVAKLKSDILLKAWVTYVDYVDAKRYSGDLALKSEIGKRATKAELNGLKNTYGNELAGIKSRLRALEDKTGSPGYSGDYNPPPNYNDDLAPGVGDILQPGPDPKNPNPN